MGRLADRFNGLTVRGTSPDGGIHGELVGSGMPRFRFVPNAFPEYESEAELAGQLDRVLADLYRDRSAARRRVVTELTELTVRSEPHWDARRRRYRQERDDLAIAGLSRDESIEVTSTGMRDFTVDIIPGTLDDSDEATFLRTLSEALSDLHRDWNEECHRLRLEHYGET